MHQLLKGCARVAKAEGHAGVAVHPTWCQEGRLLHIFHRHLDLTIPWERIQEAQQVTLSGGVDNLVDAREWERILGQALLRLVKSTHIHSFSPFSALRQGSPAIRGIGPLGWHLPLLACVSLGQ